MSAVFPGAESGCGDEGKGPGSQTHMDTAPTPSPKPLVFKDKFMFLATEEPSLGSKFLLAGTLDPKCLNLLIYEIDATSHSPEADHLETGEESGSCGAWSEAAQAGVLALLLPTVIPLAS